MRQARFVLLGTLVLLLLAAGCGGASTSPGVANLGTTAATTDASASGGMPAAPEPGGGSGDGQAISIGTGGIGFSRCMRAHGVANFPDPNGQTVTAFGPDSGIDVQSASFRAAALACRDELHGKEPQLTAGQQAKARREALALSACMREHAVPDFPDPSFGADGNAAIHLAVNSVGDLNPNNPTFQAALQACDGFKLGDKKGPGSFGSGGPK